MKRGDLVTVALQDNYDKPRPAVIAQSDYFKHHPSVAIFPVASELIETPLFRFTLEPTKKNGLKKFLSLPHQLYIH